MGTPEEYARDHPRGRTGVPCLTCSLPPAVLSEVRRARRESRLTYRQLSGWLSSAHGVSVPLTAVRDHFLFHEETR